MGKLINYLGSSKILKKIADFLNVTDVKVNGTSVVDANGVADIDLSLYVGIKVVQVLPQTGEANFIYLVPSEDPGTENVYDEYVWTEDGWELIGSTEIDLSDYYTKTESDNRYVQPGDLAAVATSGDYDDLIDKPTIPTVNDGTLTIQLNGENQQTFTANSSSDKTANIKAVDWVSNGKLGAKNLNSFPYYHDSRTINYVAWTINADGSVTANGTASGGNSNFTCHSRNMELNKLVLPNGKYILSGCATGGSSSTWEIVIERTHNGSAETIATNYSGDTEFTLNGDDYSANSVQVQLILRVRNGKQANNITFYPMIRLAEDTDDTWKPYAKTNQELTNDTLNLLTNVPLNLDKAETNNWNLIRPPYFDGSGSSGGLTYTVNADGSITFTGTSNANFAYNVKRYTQEWKLPKGRYRLTGCPSGGTYDTYNMYLSTWNNSQVGYGYDFGNGLEFGVEEETVMHLIINLKTGTETNFTIAPKIIPINPLIDDLDQTVKNTWNLIHQPFYAKTATSNGIRFDLAEDGVFYSTGTATANTSRGIINQAQNWKLPKGLYRLSGCPSGGSNSKYYLQIGRYINNSVVWGEKDYGEGVDFVVSDDYPLIVYWHVRNGTTVSNLKCKPKIVPLNPPSCDKTTAGTYTLQATVDANGKVTYSWV